MFYRNTYLFHKRKPSGSLTHKKQHCAKEPQYDALAGNSAAISAIGIPVRA
jgi:hypothetical protein